MQSKREKMFVQQNSRPTLSAAAMLLQEIERQKELGFPESNLVSSVHLFIKLIHYLTNEKQTTCTVGKSSVK